MSPNAVGFLIIHHHHGIEEAKNLEMVSLTIDSGVEANPRTADHSVGDGNRLSSNYVVDHMMKPHHAGRVSLVLAIEGDT